MYVHVTVICWQLYVDMRCKEHMKLKTQNYFLILTIDTGVLFG